MQHHRIEQDEANREEQQNRNSDQDQSRHRWSNSNHASRSEEHTSELQSLMRISYAVFCLKKKKTHTYTSQQSHNQLHTHTNKHRVTRINTLNQSNDYTASRHT